MKNILLLIILIAFFVTNPVKIYCQEDNAATDKYTLLTMPYNKRPLTLYKGQIWANAGYKFGVRARIFNELGDPLILKDEGTASVFHYYLLQIKYGIFDFLEVSAETNYLKHGERSLTTDYYSGSDNVSVNTLTSRQGMGDLLLKATARLPITYQWFDFDLSGGIFLPTAEHEALEPEHTITDIVSANSYTINYHYRNTNGLGVPLYIFGAAAKVSYSKFSLAAAFSFRDPVKEGENLRWNEFLTTSNTFIYDSQPYQYLLNNTLEINASVHFQAAGWFNVELNSNYIRSKGGWTEYWGNKYSNPEESLFSLEPGFEIQISPALRIYEYTGLPIAGKNRDAPFYLFITMSYSLIPFNK